MPPSNNTELRDPLGSPEYLLLLPSDTAAAEADADLPPLLRAVNSGDESKVNALLSCLSTAALLDAVDERGATAAHLAVVRGDHRVLAALLEAGIDSGAADVAGETALHLAARLGRATSGELLLSSASAAELEALCNAEDAQGRTALVLAAFYGHEDVIGVLRSYATGLRSFPLQRRDAFIEAQWGGHEAAAAALTIGRMLPKKWHAQDKACIDAELAVRVHSKDKQGLTPIMRAAVGGAGSEVERLCRFGADVNSPAPDGRTPLLLAVMAGHAQAAAALLEVGADLDARFEHKTALHWAAQHGDEAAVAALLRRATPAQQLARGGHPAYVAEAAIHTAAGLGHTGVVRALLDAAAHSRQLDDGQLAAVLAVVDDDDLLDDVDEGEPFDFLDACLRLRRPDSCTALHLACKNGHVAAAELLLQRGADANLMADGDCPTPLIVAVTHRKVAVVELLLRHGAAVDYDGDYDWDSDGDGEGPLTPLHHAIMGGDMAVVRLLLDRGASMEIRTVQGSDARGLAIRMGRADAAAMAGARARERERALLEARADTADARRRATTQEVLRCHHRLTAGLGALPKSLLREILAEAARPLSAWLA